MLAVDIDYAGLATVITAIGVLVAAVAGAYVTVRSTKQIRETHETMQAVDAAVNGKAPGSQTMQSQVQDLHNSSVSDRETDSDYQDAVLPLLRKLVELTEQKKEE